MARCLALTSIKDADCDPVVGLAPRFACTARGLLLGESPMMKCLEKKMMQRLVAGQGNILGCLTTAKGAVSAHCNAALDAAYLRQ